MRKLSSKLKEFTSLTLPPNERTLSNCHEEFTRAYTFCAHKDKLSVQFSNSLALAGFEPTPLSMEDPMPYPPGHEAPYEGHLIHVIKVICHCLAEVL